MTILEAQRLGLPGQEILEIMREMRAIINQEDGWLVSTEDTKGYFEDEDHRVEWLEGSLDLIEEQLTKLTEQ